VYSEAIEIGEFFLTCNVSGKDETGEHLAKIYTLHVMLFREDLVYFGKLKLKVLVFLLREDMIEYSFELLDAGPGGFEPITIEVADNSVADALVLARLELVKWTLYLLELIVEIVQLMHTLVELSQFVIK
jgi:hypothetical protein